MATHQFQGSYITFSSVPPSWRRGSKAKQFSPTFHPVGRKDRLHSMRCRPCPSVEPSLALGPKSEVLNISDFRGSSRHDDSGGGAHGPESLNNPIEVSYFQHESEELYVESPKAQNVVPTPCIIADDTGIRSLAIQNLSNKWLLTRTPLQTQEMIGALDEPSPLDLSKTPSTLQKQERGGIFRAVWCYLWGLDAAIKIPLLLCTSLYLAVNIKYGSEVSKELTPLWVLGPLITSLYVKAIRAICGLYIFTFKQTFRIVKNVPFIVYGYIFRGKLKKDMQTYLWQPLADIKNMDYNELARRKMKDFQGWLVEMYLDFIESIWPFYHRTLRFLRAANLI
ncbi:hypothetical protein OROGR_004498 [Orobanche gracilis]